MIGFTCGLPAGDDNASNIKADTQSPDATRDPYTGTTVTPAPSPNAGALRIAGLNRLRVAKRSRGPVVVQQWECEYGHSCGPCLELCSHCSELFCIRMIQGFSLKIFPITIGCRQKGLL